MTEDEARLDEINRTSIERFRQAYTTFTKGMTEDEARAMVERFRRAFIAFQTAYSNFFRSSDH